MPGNLLSADMDFPSWSGKESLSEKVNIMENYLRMMLESLRYTLSNLDTGNMNAAALSELSEEISGEAVSVAVGSLTIEASDGESSSTITIKSNGIAIASAEVSFTGVVTFTDLAGEGTTSINGGNIMTDSISTDKLKAGTITGFTIYGATIEGGTYKSSGSASDLYINSGNLYIRLADSYVTVGHIGWSPALGAFVIESAMNQPLKLISDGNLSIDSDGQIFIGASAGYSGDVTIGQVGGTIHILGTVDINGTPIP